MKAARAGRASGARDPTAAHHRPHPGAPPPTPTPIPAAPHPGPCHPHLPARAPGGPGGAAGSRPVALLAVGGA